MYVDFNITRDKESGDVLQLLEESTLKTFCSRKPSQNKTLDKLAIEFYVNGIFTDDSIETIMKKTHLSISKSNIARMFETNDEGMDPFTYKEDNWVESFELLARPSCQGVRKE